MSAKSEIINQITILAETAIHGSLSTVHKSNGPNYHVNYRGEDGKTTAYYVSFANKPAIEQGIKDWANIQSLLRTLSMMNKEEIIPHRHKPPILRNGKARVVIGDGMSATLRKKLISAGAL